MTEDHTPAAAALPAVPTPDSVPRLVGQLYADACLAVRQAMLEHLLKPLGLLSLVVVADGAFARVVHSAEWPRVRVPLEEVQRIDPGAVVELVQYVQQVSNQVIEGLLRTVLQVPVQAGSAAFAVLKSLQARPARPADSSVGLDPLG